MRKSFLSQSFFYSVSITDDSPSIIMSLSPLLLGWLRFWTGVLHDLLQRATTFSLADSVDSSVVSSFSARQRTSLLRSLKLRCSEDTVSPFLELLRHLGSSRWAGERSRSRTCSNSPARPSSSGNGSSRQPHGITTIYIKQLPFCI